MFPTMRTGRALYDEEPQEQINVSQLLKLVMHEVLNLAEKQVLASQRSYVQRQDILDGFTTLLLRDPEYFHDIPIPNCIDIRSIDEWLDTVETNDNLDDNLEVIDDDVSIESETDNSEINDDVEIAEEIQNEVFRYPSHVEVGDDNELFEMKTAQYRYSTMDDDDKASLHPIQKSLLYSIERLHAESQ